MQTIMSKIALDSNILIYNHSLDFADKRDIARKFFNENPIVSSQVISEYINVMKRNFHIKKSELMKLLLLRHWKQVVNYYIQKIYIMA